MFVETFGNLRPSACAVALFTLPASANGYPSPPFIQVKTMTMENGYILALIGRCSLILQLKIFRNEKYE